MKPFPALLFLCLWTAAPARADLAARIKASAPDAKLELDTGAEPEHKARSNLDVDAFQRFAQRYSAPAPTPAPPKETKATAGPATLTESHPSMNLAEVAKNRRLNGQLLSGLPILQPMDRAGGHQPSSGVPQFDDALFSTDGLISAGNPEQTALRQQIQQVSDSMRKFKSANLKYLNSIDIESKNAKLFQDAQEKIKTELLNFRSQLDTVREKARAIKEEKNAAVVELEELVNQRAAKLKQVADLTRQNDELNAHYTELEKQIGEVEAMDTRTEGEIRQLTDRQESLKQQFQDLTDKYLAFKKQKAAAAAAAKHTQHDRNELVDQLQDLTQKIAEEAPVNDRLKQDAVDVEKKTREVEAEILKYQQESALLDRQLADLDKMKQAAVANLAKSKREQQQHQSLKRQVKEAQEQAGKKQSALAHFEHDIKSKERSCRCSQRQLSKIISEKQLALNNQQALQGLMQSVQETAAGAPNMKLLNSILSPDGQPHPQLQTQPEPPKLAALSDPYFQQSHYFKGD